MRLGVTDLARRYAHPKAVAAMLTTPLFVVAYALSPRHLPVHSAAVIAQQVLYLSPFVLAAVGCALVLRRTSGVERRVWSLLAACVTFLLVAELNWSIQVTSVGGVEDPTGPVALVLALVPAILFGMLLFSLSRLKDSSLATRMRFLCDLLIAVVVATVVGYAYVIGPYLQHMGVTSQHVIGGVTLNTVIGVGVLTGTVSLMLGLRKGAWRLWERLVVGGIGIYSVGLLLWPLYYVSTFVQPSAAGRISESLWVLGMAWIFIGSVARLEADGLTEALRSLPPFQFRSRWIPLLFHGTATLAIPVIAFTAFQSGQRTDALVAFVGAGVLAVLLVKRNFWVAVEGGHLFERAVIDPQTGLVNKRHFSECFDREVDMAVRCGDPVSLIVMDVDDLHAVNALGGHAAGDRLLGAIARCIERRALAEHLVARSSGDEFSVLLPRTEHAEAAVLGERIRSAISVECDCTVSVGVGTFPQDGLSAHELAVNVRAAADWAKRHGKDRLVVFSSKRDELKGSGTRGEHPTASHISVVRVLAMAVDARDRSMRYHSRSVADLAWALSEDLGLAEDRRELIRMTALMHDVGKIGVPDAILQKTGPLNSEEWALIREHPLLGEQIIFAAGLGSAARWIRFHHERWDGGGYPDGLSAAQIPVESRILAICDSFDAMTSDRPYRKGLSIPAALQEIDLSIGTQFDPDIAEIFIQMTSRRFPVGGGLPEALHKV
ncbi:MAG: diguanylate cyclase [Actinomycetota bacterium]|nr:diguanylate cyclase [Actinomycetota bacterium]